MVHCGRHRLPLRLPFGMRRASRIEAGGHRHWRGNAMTRLVRSPYLPAALLLAGGAVALLAFFALPWYTRLCPPYLVQADPTCPAFAAATPYIPGGSLGPWGREAQHAPLDRYLAGEA